MFHLAKDTWSRHARTGLTLSTNKPKLIFSSEYTRVKLINHKPESTDYINASYIQYADVSPAALPTQDGTDSNDGIPRLESLSSQNLSSMSSRTYRRYISTQGPLPATFADFYTAIWEQNSLLIVMLTKEEEMNRVGTTCILISLCLFSSLNFFIFADKMPSLLAIVTKQTGTSWRHHCNIAIRNITTCSGS